MSEEAMNAGIEFKVEPYDGTYECLFCGESVRGQAALKCWQCNSNPFHRACDSQSRYAEVCPTCGRKTVEVWKVAGGGNAAPSAIIDLTGAGERAAEVATLSGGSSKGTARSLRKQRPARGLRPIVRRQVGELG